MPEQAGEREIRFIEINQWMADERLPHELIPVDFGADMGQDSEHKLWVLDVSPTQFEQIQSGDLHLSFRMGNGGIREFQETMNLAQELWWKQSVSDYAVFEMMRSSGVHPCHAMRYLQMATEKIAKASFWSRNTAPALSHVGFVSFLRRLNRIRRRKRSHNAALFGFPNFASLEAWLPTATAIGREIELISPAVMPDGPNSKYPWPHENPIQYPAGYHFPVWDELQLSQGRPPNLDFERRCGLRETDMQNGLVGTHVAITGGLLNSPLLFTAGDDNDRHRSHLARWWSRLTRGAVRGALITLISKLTFLSDKATAVKPVTKFLRSTPKF